ncbi:MAG: hypothetical protein ACYTEW_24845 [Planctomycetota bacterium]|jgi:hypothetical protein
MADLYVYQSGDGQWIVFNNGIKTFFSDESEAINMSEKIKFATEVQEFSTAIALLAEKLDTFQSVWASREYLAGAGDLAITDGDLQSLGITKAQLTAFINPFAVQLANLFGNQPVAQGDYQATIDKLRTDV